jgi:regulator of RNase E activity RraA
MRIVTEPSSPSTGGNGLSATKPKTAEIVPGPGFRLRNHIERPDPGLVSRLAAFDAPAISDKMNRLYTMCAAIRPVTPQSPTILGPACTVKVYPGDNLMVHKSLDVAKPGDVVVVDASSATTFAVLGDLVSAKARHRGIRGFIVDGLVRDLPGILELGDFPVFARGITPIGPLHRGPGEINYPVSVGGIVVHPGDVIAGDKNGVVVVPRECLADLVENLEGQAEAETTYMAAVRRGEFSMAWVDKALQEAGIDLTS